MENSSLSTMTVLPRGISAMFALSAAGFIATNGFGALPVMGSVFLAVGGTTAINFVLGSYIEPLMAGSALSMSPVLVLFAVFFWAVIWGIPGAFIGVQIMIVTLAVLRVMPSASWIAELFSGQEN